MADKEEPEEEGEEEEEGEGGGGGEEEAEPKRQLQLAEDVKKLLSSYIGVSFGVFLALAPTNLAQLQRQASELSGRLGYAEEQVRQMRSRRKEDSKANARVVEIFASHRNAWQAEEKWLLHQIDAANQEIAHLNARIAEFEKAEDASRDCLRHLERELAERDEVIGFMSRTTAAAPEETAVYGNSEYVDDDDGGECDGDGDNVVCEDRSEEFVPEFLSASAPKVWAERAILWQDVKYESVESMYDMKHFVARESPWKVDGESTGVSSKLKLLEQELLNLEKVGKSNLSKAPSLMRKQAKRYQALAGKIDDLCGRMQASDPCDSTLSLDFRTQRQTEFLLEAFRLQQHASETGQKLMGLQTEIGKKYSGDEIGSFANLATKRSLDSIGNNFKEIQRNLEIWLARIIGDLEGILARDGASRVREYYISRYPFVQ
ncbi:hypothetical protein L484_022711 [Morus notabilis]|uniref:Uncharacterized protein n=1 Tax=Morus notabilis TaxID=981085 RepID=W9SCH2_9ROSA|nr:uncharacterized protein LOC21405520 isoform X2 [Morus notabilis]EXC35160.1 hypothetical protein L484_022711 [Morus notabilis]